jgi:hypothetical protein
MKTTLAPRSDRALWSRWVGANGLGEALGLPVTALVAVATADARTSGGWAIGGAVVALLAAGAAEGAIVGGLQWRVLATRMPTLRARTWVGATVVGAVAAWTLGLPSLLLGDASGGQPPVSDAAQIALAVPLGFVAGPILAVPQWVVLRRSLEGAGRWVLANAVAWAAGMPVIFLVAGGLPAGTPPALVVVAVVVVCGLAGVIVGAIHGRWLVRLLATPRQATRADARRAGLGQTTP